jgi:hypothetical protein
MFRVTARLSTVILLCLLAALGYYVDSAQSNGISLKKIRVFIYVLTFVTLIETYVPLKFVQMGAVPHIYTELKEQSSPEDLFGVYPYAISEEALYWLPEHNRKLINPRDYKTANFNARSFTESLNTTLGIKNAKELGLKYLVVGDTPEFFLHQADLKLIYQEDNYYLFELL